MKCPNCHFENSDESSFCRECGTPLPISEKVSSSQTITYPRSKKELTIGQIFAGRYQVIEEVGRGGMGVVYKVFDKEIKEKLALKLLNPAIVTDEKMVERFRNELKLARKISHRHVCRMFDLNEAEGTRYIAMEYVPGEDLKSSMKRMGQLSLGKTILIAKQICEGLAEAHRLSVVHRDLKPSNIMIDREGKVRIMDFGIARSFEAEGVTGPRAMIGTPKYMSPEQVEGRRVDQRSDLYSLGVILYEMVVGRVPFEGKTGLSIALKHKTEAPPDPRRFNPQLPLDLSRLILRCLEKDRERRYQRAEDVISDLEKIEKSVPTQERPLSARSSFFPTLWQVLKEQKILGILAIFLAGGSLLLEFVRWILIGYYHFPRESLAVVFITIITALICTLIWRISVGLGKKQPRLKIALILIPLVIFVGILLDMHYIQQIKKPAPIISSQRPWENSIAVLPFLDLSPQKNQEYRCIGLADSIIRKLSQFRILKVISLSSALRYRHLEKSIQEIGKELNASHILTGTLQVEKDNIRVNTQVSKADDGSIIWTKSYPGKLSGVFELEDDISKSIAKSLGIRLVEKRYRAIRAVGSTNLEANEYYNYGRYFEILYYGSNEKKDFENCVKNYLEAVKTDPNYALVYWRLGIVYEALYFREYNKKDFDLMRSYFKKAYEIAPFSAEANDGLGWIYLYEGDYNKAYQYFKRSYEIDPNNSDINFHIGSFLFSIGLWEKAIKYYTRGLDIDPFHLEFMLWQELRARCYSYLGRFKEAADYMRKLLEIKSTPRLHFIYAIQLIMMKEYGEAEKQIAKAGELSPEEPSLRPYQAWLLAARGDKKRALELIKDEDYKSGQTITSLYSLLGMKDEAIKNIKFEIEKGFSASGRYVYSYPLLKTNPCYDNLRDDPRFQKILKQEKKKYEAKLKKFGDL